MRSLTLASFLAVAACGNGLHAHVDTVQMVPTLYVTPAIPIVLTDMRITCILPESNGIPGTYLWGITDLFQSGGPADQRQLTKVISTPCEPFHVYCAYMEHGGKPMSASLNITPGGECSAPTTK